MRIPQRWLDSALFRYFLTETGFRHSNTHQEYEFEPYFQYKIGPYQSDNALYFITRPSKSVYHYEIFAKMLEYEGYDLVSYLDYHYKAYPNKKEFLRFIRYETQNILNSNPSTEFETRLKTTLEWVKEEEESLASLAHTAPAAGAGLPAINNLTADSPLPDDVSMEAARNALVGPFPGKIQLNNQLNTEKYIQLWILTQGLMAPGRDGKHLFKKCSDSDLAAILHHFEHLGDLRLNTLQKKVAEARKHLDLNDPKVEKLHQALLEFFFH